MSAAAAAAAAPQPSTAADLVSFEDEAGPLSRFLLSYLDKLFEKGKNGGLVHEDLGLVAEQDKALSLHVLFEKQWLKEAQKPRQHQSLWAVLWRTVGYRRLVLAILLYTIYSALSFGPILILTQLTGYFEGKVELTTAQLWVLVALMGIFPAAATFFVAQSNVVLAHIGMQFRNVLVDKIYRKSMCLAPSSRQAFSTGQIINMFASDTGS